MQLKKTLKELQRRHVVKAGIAYLVVSWLTIQVLSILFPAFEASSSAMKTTILILGIGFPIWLVIAWVYDFSPEGIKKTEANTYDSEDFKKKNTDLNRFIVGGLSIAVILLVFNTFRISSKMNRIDSIYQKALSINFTSSIAVLAFNDLSPTQDQEYFAKGLSEQIQRRLSRHKDLKVTNTNSSFTFQDKDVSIEVIGQELKVSFILKGSVIKSGETFRVDVDLVNTTDGSTIWSKQFDQKVEDILYTYDEIAKAVVNYLKLTFDYQDVRLRKVDPEAYDLYLKAENVIQTFDHDGRIKADSLIRRSLEIDSTYSPSWTTLSMTTLHKGVFEGYYKMHEAIALGLIAAKRSIELNPENSKGYTWLSNWQWHDKEVNLSNENLAKSIELGPNNSFAWLYASHQAARTNRIKESLAFSEKAVLLDPKDPDAYSFKAYAEMILEDYVNAELSMKSYMELVEQPEDSFWELAMIYRLNGKFEKALEAINKQPDRYFRYYGKSMILLSEGKKDEAFAIRDAFLKFYNEESIDDSSFDFDTALIYAHFGDNDKAFYHLNKCYNELLIYTEWLFQMPEFKNLYDDPRWDELLDKIGKEFNYDFKHKT